METPLKFVTLSTPAITGTLYTCSRPLPARFVGFRDGTGFFCYDVADEYKAECRALDAHEVTMVDAAGLDALVAAAVTAHGGYTLDDYRRALGDGFSVEAIGGDFGVRVIVVDPLDATSIDLYNRYLGTSYTAETLGVKP